MTEQSNIYDLFIIGGGVNGCGIARDAAGRGFSVALAEMHDLAWATSSASTKLFHGGLRYLEYFELKLVRDALIEREILLRAMPHISWPMRFVLPWHKTLKFEGETPASKLISFFLPWTKGSRPAWMIRFGLFMYDHMGGRKILPATKKLDLRKVPEGAPLRDHFSLAYEYSDVWVQDSRLVVLNARDAARRGADIMVRTKVLRAERDGEHWAVTVQNRDGSESLHKARMLINAGGPWVEDIIKSKVGINAREGVRLVRGSHIVTKKLFDHEKCYFFQGKDARIIFAIPYENDFTLIGTTDADHGEDPDRRPECTPEEADYLRAFAAEYFKKPIAPEDIVWSYAGVRPLYDDGASSARAATREYVLSLNESSGAPLLSIFGGKITTYRKLAEDALDTIQSVLKTHKPEWTKGAALPGGDFPHDGVPDQVAQILETYRFLNADWALRLVRAYGTETADVLGESTTLSDLGQNFGATLYQREVDWLVANEFAFTANDILWRRGKLGLRVSAIQVKALEDYLAAEIGSNLS